MCFQRWCLALELLFLLHLLLATSTQGTLHKLCACDCVLKARVRRGRGNRVRLSPERGACSPDSRHFYAARRAVARWGIFLSLGESTSLFSQGLMTKTGPEGDGKVGPSDCVPCFVVWKMCCFVLHFK